MYAKGYGNLIQAELTVEGLPAKNGLNACLDCAICSAACPHGIDIHQRIGFLMAMTAGGYKAA